MKHIEEPARRTPVMAETDVLVVGSEPGGLSAVDFGCSGVDLEKQSVRAK